MELRGKLYKYTNTLYMYTKKVYLLYILYIVYRFLLYFISLRHLSIYCTCSTLIKGSDEAIKLVHHE